MYFVVNLREKARNQERGVRGGRREGGSEEGVKAVHVALKAGHSHSCITQHYIPPKGEGDGGRGRGASITRLQAGGREA